MLGPKILEISRIAVFKHAYPAATDFIRSGAPLIPGSDPSLPQPLDTAVALQTLRRIRAGTYDLVVVPAVNTSHRGPEAALKRMVRYATRGIASSPLTSSLIAAITRVRETEVVLVDISDDPSVSRESCNLVPTFLAYFKRELYPNRSFDAFGDVDRFQHRVFPLPLVLPDDAIRFAAAPKSVDVFFSGAITSPVRDAGIVALKELGRAGFTVDIASGRLAYDEYLARMSRAWLTWSPEGFGWDCYRHYEACFAGSVPLINLPRAQRQLYLTNGQHCIYYDTEKQPLGEVVAEALRDRERLQRIAANARRHVIANHSRRATAAAMKRVILDRLRNENRLTPAFETWS